MIQVKVPRIEVEANQIVQDRGFGIRTKMRMLASLTIVLRNPLL
jgi:hypothetical protein